MNHLVCIEYQEKLEQEIAELKRHLKYCTSILGALRRVESLTTDTLDLTDDHREGYSKPLDK